LGYLRAQDFTTGSKFGNVLPNFSLDNVVCSGNEASLEDCAHSKEDDDCGIDEGAGVICTEIGKTVKNLI
jgi:hypothetical protein